jgi:hypothetical protein
MICARCKTAPKDENRFSLAVAAGENYDLCPMCTLIFCRINANDTRSGLDFLKGKALDEFDLTEEEKNILWARERRYANPKEKWSDKKQRNTNAIQTQES